MWHLEILGTGKTDVDSVVYHYPPVPLPVHCTEVIFTFHSPPDSEHAPYIANMSRTMGMVAAEVVQVPNQPLSFNVSVNYAHY